MIKLWRRFRAWLYDLRHPNTTIEFGNPQAIPHTFSSVPDMSEWPPIHIDGEATANHIDRNLLTDMQQRAKERENERVRALGNVLDWPIGDYFEFGKMESEEDE